MSVHRSNNGDIAAKLGLVILAFGLLFQAADRDEPSAEAIEQPAPAGERKS